MAPRVPVRIKEVIYTLSPFEQTVLSGLWKDLPAKMRRKWNEVTAFPLQPSSFPEPAFRSSLLSLCHHQLKGCVLAALD